MTDITPVHPMEPAGAFTHEAGAADNTPGLMDLKAHGSAVLDYAKASFRSSWEALSVQAQADVHAVAQDLAQLTLAAAQGKDVAGELRLVRLTMGNWTWTGRRAARKHLLRGAAHQAFKLAGGLSKDMRRDALRHSADLMRGRPSAPQRKRR